MPSAELIHYNIAAALLKAGHQLRDDEFVEKTRLEDWSEGFETGKVPVLTLDATMDDAPSAGQVPLVAERLAICANVCHELGVRMRPIGHHTEKLGKVGRKDERDRLHNWSPINLDRNTDSDTEVLYVSFEKITSITKVNDALINVDASAKTLRCFCGETLYDVGRLANKEGLTLPIVPAPKVLSVGGVMAIAGHGSRLSSSKSEQRPDGTQRDWPGTFSASIDSATVIAWNPTAQKYEARIAPRGSEELAFAAVSLGRIIVVDVTLRCQEDFCLGVKYTKPTVAELFDTSIADPRSLEARAKEGSFEILGFRNPEDTSKPYVYLAEWTHSSQPAKVEWKSKHPLDDLFTKKEVRHADLATWDKVAREVEKLNDKEVEDTARNPPPPTAAANQRMYAHSEATPVAASGYCLLVPRHQLQQAAKVMRQLSVDILSQTETRKTRNCHRHLAFECRCADMDDHGLPPGARAPILSTAAPHPSLGSGKHIVVWVSVLSLQNSKTKKRRAPYFKLLEEKIFETARNNGWKVRPEWAKGWGFNDKDAWKWSAAKMADWLEDGWPGTSDAPYSWRKARQVAWSMDPHGLFSSDFHDKLLPRL